MKLVLIACIILFATACKTTTNSESENKIPENQTAMNNNKMCPDEGVCNVKLMAKTMMRIIMDEATQKPYPQFEAGDNTIVEYTYSKKGPENTVDGDYSESINFELPDFNDTLILNDAELQNVNLLYGKQCYCKGEAGHYRVNKGTLKLQKTATGIVMDLNFTVPEVSQRITKIHETLKK